MNAPASSTSPELVITRTLSAPRALVWKAWADPRQMVQWMGPRFHPASHYENDFRPGGTWRSCLASTADRHELWLGGVYHELVEPERMVFTFRWDGDDGRPTNEMLVTLTFAEDGANTKMTLRQTRFVSTEQRDDHNEGWCSCIDRLEEFVISSKTA